MRNINDNVMEKWFDLRSEELETNLDEKDRENMFSFDAFLDDILSIIPEDKKDWVIELFDDYEDRHCVVHNYWTEKYYMTGFRDGVGLVNGALR